MSNVVKDKILNENKNLLVFQNRSEFPSSGISTTVYYCKSDNTNSNLATSYIYTSGAYVKLSDTSSDILFFDKFSSFPSTGDINSLYVSNDLNYIYQWNSSDLVYNFIKQVSSIVIQLCVGQKVKYFHPAITNIFNLNTVYSIGMDNRTYVSDSVNKYYLDINMIIVYFKPLSLEWTDIIGSFTPVEPPIIPSNIDIALLNSFTASYDTDRNGIVDGCDNANKLQGKSANFFIDYTDTAVQNAIISGGGNVIIEPSEW